MPRVPVIMSSDPMCEYDQEIDFMITKIKMIYQKGQK
jgi:hypothetical protein